MLASGPGSAAVRSPGQQSLATATDPASYDSLVLDPDRLVLGGQRVVGEEGYDTIQAAWDDAQSGDVVYVHSSYDASVAGEQFPIELDYRQKEVALVGGHPSGSIIDAGDTDENVIEVIGRGSDDYRNNPLVRNLTLVGGGIGLRVSAAPYASFADVVCYDNGRHGFVVAGHRDSSTGDWVSTPGVTFRNCQAWGCGGSGFRLNNNADPDGTTFVGCHAQLNGDFGVMLRGDASRWLGGTIQNNGIRGADCRNGANQLLDGVYFEGNGTDVDDPNDVFASGAHALAIRDSCFDGDFAHDFANGREQGEYGVVIADCTAPRVVNCTYRNYGGSFLWVRNTIDADIYRETHHSPDPSKLLRRGPNRRLRSDGVILPSDLRAGEQRGKFRGDTAIHDGSGATPMCHAVWDGDRWISQATGDPI